MIVHDNDSFIMIIFFTYHDHKKKRQYHFELFFFNFIQHLLKLTMVSTFLSHHDKFILYKTFSIIFILN